MRFAVANEHGAAVHFEDAVIRDGDLEDVGGEVFEAGFRTRHGLGVDVPVDLPEFRGDLIEQAGLFHLITELGFEDDGESFDREIEIDSGGIPAAIGSGESAAGDDVMDMGVILQGASPGVQHAKEARQIGADVTLIKSKFFDGLRGGLKQGGVSGTLVFAHKGAQVLWHREGEKEMVRGELAVDLFF